MTNMIRKKFWIVPIPDPRTAERRKENADGADISLTDAAIKTLEDAFDTIPKSAVFGCVRIKI